MTWIVALPVLLPILGAGLSLVLFQRPRLQLWLSIAVLVAVGTVAGVLMYRADTYGPQTLWVGGWQETSGSCWLPTGCRR